MRRKTLGSEKSVSGGGDWVSNPPGQWVTPWVVDSTQVPRAQSVYTLGGGVEERAASGHQGNAPDPLFLKFRGPLAL